MRELWIVVWCVLTACAHGQYIEPAMPFDAHQLEQAAVKSFADLEAKVSRLEAENESLRLQIRELTKGEPEQAKPTIKVFKILNCPACELLERERSRYVKAGWEWKSELDQSASGTYPQIQICTSESCSGKMHVTKDTIDAAVNRFLGRPVIQRLVKPKSTEYRAPRKTWGMHEGHVTPSVIGMTIEYHLTHAPHFIDITGMTVAEMEAKHQELHR